MNPLAADILAKNLYAAVATTDVSGNPWNATVFFVCDEAGNVYWASATDSQHSQNIRANGKVFLAIYDSTVPWGKGAGVFAQASAREVTDPHEIAKACQLRQGHSTASCVYERQPAAHLLRHAAAHLDEPRRQKERPIHRHSRGRRNINIVIAKLFSRRQLTGTR